MNLNNLFNLLDTGAARKNSTVPTRPSPYMTTRRISTNKYDKEQFDWAPFYKIPDCSRFRVKTSEMDPVFEAYDINKRLKSEKLWEPYKNKRLTRYAQHQIIMLRTSTNSNMYWLRYKVLAERSVVFGLMAVASSFERFHRELPLHLVMRLVMGSHSIARCPDKELKLRRVYIPKPNGKLRPLGVPTPVWRVYLTLLNWALVTRLSPLVPSWQHAYRPKLGTLSAWREILGSVEKSRFIYEFDLKGFFDSVKTTDTLMFLRPHLNSYIFSILYRLTQAVPEFKSPPRGEVDERAARLGEFRRGEIDLSAGNVEHFLEYLTLELEERGFPQGANTSPLLSILSLARKPAPTFAKMIMYADDGIVYSDKPFSESQVADYFAGFGLKLAENKSGWVRAVEWKKPLVFLGLSFDGKDLKASTRSGASLLFDKHELVEAVSYRDRDGRNLQLPEGDGILPTPLKADLWSGKSYVLWHPVVADKYAFFTKGDALRKLARLQEGELSTQSGWRVARITPDGTTLTDDVHRVPSWYDVGRSNVLGFLQSRLYGDSWNTVVEQDFSLSATGTSWVRKRGRKVAAVGELNFANSTSYAFYDIAALIRKSRRNELHRRLFYSRRISLADWNLVRSQMGMKAITVVRLSAFKPV